VNLVDKVLNFSEKYHSGAQDAFLPVNTVLGNDPVIIPTNGIHIPAVK
jgi:hypothetical protein